MKTELQRYSSESLRAGRFVRLEIKESYSAVVREKLEERVFGQEEAVTVVASVVTKNEAGLKSPDSPAAVLMFLGPTGTGKTELGRALSELLLGGEDQSHFMKIDCAEFAEDHTIMRIIGAPPSYTGYGDELVFDEEFLSKENVIILDEVEKAGPAFYKLLLSVFDSGTLHARMKVEDEYYDPNKKAETKEVMLDFGKSYIIMTSNLGAEKIAERNRGTFGFQNSLEVKGDVRSAAMEGLKQHFASIPEFLARVDETVVFKPLEEAHYHKIYGKFVAEINELTEEMGVGFSTTEDLESYLILKTIENDVYGARSMKHIINASIMPGLADLLAGVPDVTTIVADLENGEVVFFGLMEPSHKKKKKTIPKLVVAGRVLFEEKEQFIVDKDAVSIVVRGEAITIRGKDIKSYSRMKTDIFLFMSFWKLKNTGETFQNIKARLEEAGLDTNDLMR